MCHRASNVLLGFVLPVFLLGTASLVLVPRAFAAIPPLMHFQGYLTEDHDGSPGTAEVPAEGTYLIKFSIVSETGVEYWHEERDVDFDGGHFAVVLGSIAELGGSLPDTSGPLNAGVFGDYRPFVQMEILAGSPAPPPGPMRIPLGSSPFAFLPESLDGSSGGTITGSIDLSGHLTAGSLSLPGWTEGHVLTADGGGNAVWTSPAASSGFDSVEEDFSVTTGGNAVVRLEADHVGEVSPGIYTHQGSRVTLSHMDDPTSPRAVLGSGPTAISGGTLDLYHDGNLRISNWEPNGENVIFEVNAQDNLEDFQPSVRMRDRWGNETVRILPASDSENGPEISLLYNDEEYVELVGSRGDVDGGARLELRALDSSSNLVSTIRLHADADAGGGTIWVRDREGNNTIVIDGDQDLSPGNGRIRLRDTAGNDRIVLSSADGRIKSCLVEITGGCDLAEGFDVNDRPGAILEPGTVVSIDPKNAGELVVSRHEYDRTVAGVVSGAGGVNPGMIMGQEGSIANGNQPVALVGRVYVRATASNGAIRPGDLLTTASDPGIAMKVTEHSRAQGAIVGKAMTSLTEGTGLVLVLVSLQ